MLRRPGAWGDVPLAVFRLSGAEGLPQFPSATMASEVCHFSGCCWHPFVARREGEQTAGSTTCISMACGGVRALVGGNHLCARRALRWGR